MALGIDWDEGIYPFRYCDLYKSCNHVAVTTTTIEHAWVRPEWELRLSMGYKNPDLLPAVSPDILKIL